MRASLRKYALFARWCLVTSALGSSVVFAQTQTEPVKSLTGYAGPTDTPGVGKIVFAFVVTILIGVAAVWVLRRYMPRVVAVLPQLGARAAANSTLRVVSSRAVHPGLRLHVVEVEGSTLVVAESRAGVALTIIPARTTSAITSPDEAGR